MANQMYASSSDIFTCLLDVSSLFAEMDNIHKGFGDAIFTATITESLQPVQKWMAEVSDKESFAKWLGIVFADIPVTEDISTHLISRMSSIYLKVEQAVTERLRGYSIYVLGYTSGGLLLVSKDTYSTKTLKQLLGGIL